jgi:hypothetical protein
MGKELRLYAIPRVPVGREGDRAIPETHCPRRVHMGVRTGSTPFAQVRFSLGGHGTWRKALSSCARISRNAVSSRSRRSTTWVA